MSKFDLTWPREQGHVSLIKGHTDLKFLDNLKKDKKAAMQNIISLSQTV